MTSQTASFPVLHNIQSQRFEIQIDENCAFLSYIKNGEQVLFDHTYVPDRLRGKGLAATLVRTALEEARQLRWKVVPCCSYVAAFIERHPEYAGLVDRPDAA